MFEATYYKLLLLYYNVVVSVLLALATNTEAYCSCNSTLHATYDKIHTTCTNKTIPNGPFSHSWSNNTIIMPGILCLKFPFYLMLSHMV